MTKIAFLGLGVMGGPMAGHLAKACHEVTVYNRTTAHNVSDACEKVFKDVHAEGAFRSHNLNSLGNFKIRGCLYCQNNAVYFGRLRVFTTAGCVA